MRHHQAKILEHRKLGPGLFSIWLELREVGETEPGQFFEFATGVRFLRRALSVADCEGDRIRFVLRTVGAGTDWLAGLAEGNSLDLIGPLGQGVKIPQEGPVMLLGGGVGIAPLLYLARKLNEGGLVTDAILAARSAEEIICEAEFSSLCREVIVATDDGSRGKKGFLTDILPTLRQTNDAKVFYACGPEPMLFALKRLGLNQPIYAFLESRMGCGIGLCMGCAVRGSSGRYRRVCLEGPVFDLGEIEL